MSCVMGLIVARGGSKGVPKKNLRLLAGKPLISWTFQAARMSRSLDQTFLSTDSAEIAALASATGIKVPFMRPAELAGDSSPVVDAAIHALDWLAENSSYRPDYLMLLQPTSPFRTGADIDSAIALLTGREDAVISVAEMGQHPYYARTIDQAGRLRNLIETGKTELRRQDLPPVYTENGAIYLVRADSLRRDRRWIPDNSLAYIMTRGASLDIDTEQDFQIADFMMRQSMKGI